MEIYYISSIQKSLNIIMEQSETTVKEDIESRSKEKQENGSGGKIGSSFQMIGMTKNINKQFYNNFG